MNALIILAHQHAEGSFCQAVAQVAKSSLEEKGFQVTVRDLYAENFNPVLTQEELSTKKEDVSGELLADIQQVLDTDVFVVVHPNWWGMPPAILKGWIDRVIRQGFCYAFTENGPVRMLEGRKAIVFTTANTPQEIEVQVNGDPLDNLWKNIVFKTVGIDDCVRLNFASVIMSDENQRRLWLDDVRRAIENL